MIRFELKITKSDILTEVARLTSYTGAKMPGDESAYNRIFVVEQDADLLDPYWFEACSAVTTIVQPYLSSIEEGDEYSISLSLPSNWDPLLKDGLKSSIRGYFIRMLTAKWYKITNRQDVDIVLADAVALLQDVHAKVYSRTRTKSIPAKRSSGGGGGGEIPQELIDFLRDLYTNGVSGDIIANGAITSNKLANGAVSTDKIGSKAIYARHIADHIIDAPQILSESIDHACMAGDAIGQYNIIDGAVTKAKLADNSVSTAKIEDGAVTSAKLADNSVKAEKIKANAITETKIADGAITGNKISNASIAAAKLASNSVITSKILNSAVTNDKIADGTIGSSKLDTTSDFAHAICSPIAGTKRISSTITPVELHQSGSEYPGGTAYYDATNCTIHLQKGETLYASGQADNFGLVFLKWNNSYSNVAVFDEDLSGSAGWVYKYTATETCDIVIGQTSTSSIYTYDVCLCHQCKKDISDLADGEGVYYYTESSGTDVGSSTQLPTTSVFLQDFRYGYTASIAKGKKVTLVLAENGQNICPVIYDSTNNIAIVGNTSGDVIEYTLETSSTATIYVGCDSKSTGQGCDISYKVKAQLDIDSLLARVKALEDAQE